MYMYMYIQMRSEVHPNEACTSEQGRYIQMRYIRTSEVYPNEAEQVRYIQMINVHRNDKCTSELGLYIQMGYIPTDMYCQMRNRHPNPKQDLALFTPHSDVPLFITLSTCHCMPCSSDHCMLAHCVYSCT